MKLTNCIIGIMLILLCSCCETNDVTDKTEQHIPLSIEAVKKDFISPPQKMTRTVNDNYSTTFADGDKIGLIMLNSAGGIMDGINNIPYTYNLAENKWTTTHAEAIYAYSNAAYLAYYPYDENLPADIISKEAITNNFTPKTDQSSIENYNASDLIIAQSKLEPGKSTLVLPFEHCMSLLSIDIMERNYITNDGFAYSVPMVKAPTLSITVSGTPCTSYGERNFRLIIKPGAVIEFNLSYTTNNDKSIIRQESLTANYGKYAEYVYQYGTTTTRNLQVGDYFFDDGSIVPKSDIETFTTSTTFAKQHCLGMIFKVGAYGGDVLADYEGSIKKIHGYVVSLLDAGNKPWGTDNDRSNTGANDSQRGYKNTQTLLTYYANKDYAAQAADNYNKTYATPEGVSKWYLPANTQMLEAWNARGSLDFSKVGGNVFYNGSGKKWYHTSTGLSNGSASVFVAHDGELSGLDHRGNGAYIRPIFTF